MDGNWNDSSDKKTEKCKVSEKSMTQKVSSFKENPNQTQFGSGSQTTQRQGDVYLFPNASLSSLFSLRLSTDLPEWGLLHRDPSPSPLLLLSCLFSALMQCSVGEGLLLPPPQRWRALFINTWGLKASGCALGEGCPAPLSMVCVCVCMCVCVCVWQV